jgi:hypothetical protein
MVLPNEGPILCGMEMWDRYVESLKSAGQVNELSWAPDDAATQANLCRQLAMNVSQGYFLLCQSTADHPDFAPFEHSVFLLQPNPDAVYYYAPVSGNGTYRIVGERGNAPVVGFATGKILIGLGDPPGPGYNNYDLDNLELESDGSFEVVFSSERPADHKGNWLYLNPETRFIIVRQFSYDWGRERDVRLAIERLDVQPLKPTPTPADIDGQLRALFGSYPGTLSRQALGTIERMRSKGLVNEMALHDFAELGNSKEWPQAYFECLYELRADEAIILESELPVQRHYWNVQVCDGLWNQIEFVYRQSSLNGHQAVVDDDGKFRAVLSAQDPGIHNWLDSGGHSFGCLIGRWYRCSTHPTPTIKKVPFADLRQHLPASTRSISIEERHQALRRRRVGAQLRRRW